MRRNFYKTGHRCRPIFTVWGSYVVNEMELAVGAPVALVLGQRQPLVLLVQPGKDLAVAGDVFREKKNVS